MTTACSFTTTTLSYNFLHFLMGNPIQFEQVSGKTNRTKRMNQIKNIGKTEEKKWGRSSREYNQVSKEKNRKKAHCLKEYQNAYIKYTTTTYACVFCECLELYTCFRLLRRET